MIKIGTVYGDVIEAGGVKNVTNNYYGQHAPDGEQDAGEGLCVEEKEIPEALRSKEAEELMEALVEKGLLDDAWQPLGLSRPQAAMLADRVAEVLGIGNKWKTFEQLWHRKNLRNDYNTAASECGYFDDFRKKLSRIIR